MQKIGPADLYFFKKQAVFADNFCFEAIVGPFLQ
jgi:hypothetical protein